MNDQELETLDQEEGFETEVEETEEAEHEETEATDEQGEAEPEPEGDEDTGYIEIKDPKVKARVDQLTREKWEARRKAESLERKLKELESKSEPPKEVAAPDADLAIDDPKLFAEQQQKYRDYLKAQYAHEHQEEQRKSEAEKLHKEQFDNRVSAYNSNIARLKIDPQQLAKAAQSIEKAGLNDDVINYLLEDEDGPLMVAHLGSNIDDLIEVAGMPPYKAIAYMERTVRTKAAKKKTSSAPPPTTKVKGSRPAGQSTPDGWEIS